MIWSPQISSAVDNVIKLMHRATLLLQSNNQHITMRSTSDYFPAIKADLPEPPTAELNFRIYDRIPINVEPVFGLNFKGSPFTMCLFSGNVEII